MRVRKLDCVNVSLQRGSNIAGWLTSRFRIELLPVGDVVLVAHWFSIFWFRFTWRLVGWSLFFWFAVVRGAFNAEYFMIHFGAMWLGLRHLSQTTLDVLRTLSASNCARGVQPTPIKITRDDYAHQANINKSVHRGNVLELSSPLRSRLSKRDDRSVPNNFIFISSSPDQNT